VANQTINKKLSYSLRNKGLKMSEIFDHVAYAYKRKQTSQFNNLLALDDFGSGLNTCEIAEFMKPDIIKLDRSLLTGIDSIDLPIS